MKRQEIYALTGLRGVAATAVMFYHFGAASLITGTAAIFLGHGYLMVDLFLILSGFIIALTYGKRFEQAVSWQDYKVFLWRRVARVYPLYALMIISAGVLVATGWMDHWPGPPIPASMLIDLTMLQSVVHVPSLDTPGWSISAEWVANILFPLLVVLCLRRTWLWLMLLMLAALITLQVITLLPALALEPKRAGLLDVWHYGTVFPVIRCLADFIMGIFIFRISKLNWVQTILNYVWVAPLLTVITLMLMCVKQTDVWIVALFPWLILSLVPNTNLISRIVGSKPIYKLGELSYAIYLIHNQMNYFILVLAKQIQEFGISMNSAHAIAMFIFVGIVVLLADFAFRFIEKPARDFLNSFVSNKTTAIEFTYAKKESV